MAFTDRDGYEDLSASFRSLYKSMFGGHPSQSGDYFNDLPSGHAGGVVVPDISNSPSDLGLSNSSLPLGASATALFSSLRNPQFTSLMDSFRDIAETNSWDKLDPAQIQGLMDSFKTGEHDKFGLDPDLYAELHSSFNQFLSQLNNRFLTGSSNSNPQLSQYNQYNHHSTSVMAHGGHSIGSGRGMVPKYHAHHQLDVVSPLVNMHQVSPPSSFPPNRTPSPHTSPTQGQLANLPVGANPTHVNQQFGGFVSTSHTPPLTSIAPPTGTQDVGFRSAATDLFDDDDDFDWSKLM